MGELIETHNRLRLVAPVHLNVFAFQVMGSENPLDFGALKALTARLEEEGTTYMSPSILNGDAIIRGAVCNWRTDVSDVEAAFEALVGCLENSSHAN